jgi:HME family heavy-metal exporter
MAISIPARSVRRPPPQSIAGQPLSVASMIGFITLAGISARNGILKVSHYINLALHEGETFGRQLIVRGRYR